jgi:hypothetical protein
VSTDDIYPIFRHTILAAGLFATLCSQAASLQAPLDAQLNADYAKLEAFYQDLHAHPELGFNEHETAAKLAERAKALGFEVSTGVGGTGVVAILRNGPGPTVMLRTEMDALPVLERPACHSPARSPRRTPPATPRQWRMPAVTTCTCRPGTAPPS